MDEFPSNSRSRRTRPEKQETKKVERVVEGEVVRRKKPLGRRMSETFVGGDARNVWGFVAFDILIPAAKDMVADAVSQGFERMLFGETRGTHRRGRSSHSSGYIDYRSRYDPRNRRDEPRDRDSRQSLSRRARANFEFDEIILSTRVEADEVIERLYDLVEKYETATVADLYDMVGVTSSYTDDKYGWTDMQGARVVRAGRGYLLDLPRPEPLD